MKCSFCEGIAVAGMGPATGATIRFCAIHQFLMDAIRKALQEGK